jgi:enoyl-CoA hydratase/carnithine racemase
MTAKDIVVRRYKYGQHILVAEMYRPKVKNAFNDAMYEQLIEAFEQLNGDDSLHALVITGHGDFFTSGADLAQGISTDDNGALILPSASPLKTFMDMMVKCPKLLVAAVNGRAIGIGVTLLLHCDFVYAVEHATFWTPFMRIGVVPEFASSFTFPHVLGPQLANDMLMRSRVIDVKRAAAHGLVGHVLPASGFLEKVLADVEPMVSVPLTAKSLPAYKSLLRRISEPRIREAMHQEFLELDRRLLMGETQEAFKQVASQLKPKSSKL